MTKADQRRRVLSRIAHDVGKHVARAAVNVHDGAAPAAVVDMLAKDLYALRDGARASSVLAGWLAEADEALRDEPRIARCVALLAEADRLEPDLRARMPEAIARCAQIAREVRHELLAAASDTGEPGGAP